MRSVLSIVGLCVLAAVCYGVVHDQVTARVCVEYFTIGHPRVVDSDDPTVLGLVWGILATWWVGAILGAVLALAARAGGRPKLGARDVVRPLLVLLALVGAGAVAAGVLGAALARCGAVVLLEPLASQVPRDRHVAFLADLWAHLWSYGGGALGAAILGIRTWRRRGRSGATGRIGP
jgi:hypothetical protein